jgi:hypothetical protein
MVAAACLRPGGDFIVSSFHEDHQALRGQAPVLSRSSGGKREGPPTPAPPLSCSNDHVTTEQSETQTQYPSRCWQYS